MAAHLLPSRLPTSLLIANRGEIAIRIARTARRLGIRTVAIYSPDDAASLHVRMADEAMQLDGRGAAAYLSIEGVVGAAISSECTAVHPGYGFLSESPAFAQACAAAGLTFVGPSPEQLSLLGDKVRARATAVAAGLRVLGALDDASDLDAVTSFLRATGGPIMLKAVAGGGGRGMRIVHHESDLADAVTRCSSEAHAAFGDGRVFAEHYLPTARHIEVQIVGDGERVVHLGERECSVQRRHQKLVEIAPAPGLDDDTRARLHDAAVRLGACVGYRNIGTVEFLLDTSATASEAGEPFVFMEANPRLQVEHTVTEQVTGVDLVEVQLRVASGASVDETLERWDGTTRGWAIQARVNLESVAADGSSTPSAGVLTAYDMPSGPGVRIDGYGYTGYPTNASFDSLLAKVIVHSTDGAFSAVADRMDAALAECRIEGADTNVRLLRDIVSAAPFRAGTATTGLIGQLAASGLLGRAGHVDRNPVSANAVAPNAYAAEPPLADGEEYARSPMLGTVASLVAEPGAIVAAGGLIAVIEAMKMEHEVRATSDIEVRRLSVAVGDTVRLGQALAIVRPGSTDGRWHEEADDVDLDHIRPDLEHILERHRRALDAARPDAVAKRHRLGLRTARENVDDLVDAGTFIEFGPLAIAAQRRRRTVEELIDKSPADGMVTGIGSVNGDLFGDPMARCAVLAYDYTVFAGTQGLRNHAKTDRMLHAATEGKLPLVLYAEGGGGRPGEDSGDYGETFAVFAKLSGLVPMVGIVAGRCYAGNASLLGCCDVVIATRTSNIGMGGPAMIEGGGLGVFRPEEIGPIEVQSANGVVDVVADDEAHATQIAKQYLSYFQGRLATWDEPDQREMRRIIPENRLRAYDVRRVIETLADVGTLLELRRDFGLGILTALIRVEGRPLGVMANNPVHLGGAIDADAADKAARFMQLCDAFDIPIVSFVDTPGIMVGPEVEKTALVRHSSRLFLTGANITVPTFGVVLRKVYGLGGIAMTGGSFKANLFTVSWPTGEWGTMGLEGSVHLAYRNEMAAIVDPVERRTFFDAHVAAAYESGRAVRLANAFSIDDAIDPADTRYWLANMLASLRPPAPREGKKRSFIDAW
jgi:acetyl/propionyl-CoA carboxylase alpha subunit/acetyl-CoA carboxylase carboxyltransferase component